LPLRTLPHLLLAQHSRKMAQSRSPEQATYGMGDHLDLSANADLLDRSYSSNAYNGAANSTSSSKAVLAALRALQDKIRRLEAERSQALDEAAQLRHQLKNQEVEAEHTKQREQLAAQKGLHEVRAAYERLLTDKSELEVRLSKFEEKNKVAQSHIDDLQAKIRVLEDEKHAGEMKLKDLDHQRAQTEAQIRLAQQKEEGEYALKLNYMSYNCKRD
jgi:chromosome segregation ATPase